MQILHPILRIKLNPDLPTQARRPTIQSTRLNARNIGHDFELRVQRRSALAAEEVLVDLARGTFDVPGLGGAGGDAEVAAGDNGVGGVRGAGPFLAVGAVAESYGLLEDTEQDIHIWWEDDAEVSCHGEEVSMLQV